MLQIPYGNGLLSFNLSKERAIHLLSLLIIIFFLFFFFFSFLFSMPCNFSHDILLGIFAMPMVFAPIFCLNHFRVFNLVGFFCLNFCLGCPFEFSTWQAFFFFFQTLYFLSLSMLIGWSISSPSKFVILMEPPDMIFLIIKGLDHLGFIFPLGSKISSLSTFRTKSPSLRFLGFTFLLNALSILFWYPCASYYALDLFIYQSQSLIFLFHPILL